MATKAVAPPNPQSTYDSTLTKFVRRAPITLKTSGAETSSYSTDDGIYVEAVQLSLTLTVTTSSSPTSLDVDVQGSADGTNWFKLASFAQFTTGTGSRYVTCAGAPYVRYVSTIVGTSYTYSISGTYRF